jgi:hypothetical protein
VAAAEESVARRHRALAAAALACALHAAEAEELKNWFDDPFFQVRDSVPACPLPRGPFIDATDMRREAHARVERGTSCWLAGQCTKANAYQYDAAIADEVRGRFERSAALRDATLWVTVQRRIVWVEGCAAAGDAARRIERLLHGVADVEQVIVHVARRPGGPLPYPTRDGTPAGRAR